MGVLFFLSILMLSGCFGGQTAEEKMYEIMEETVQKEQPFQEVQQPLAELEKKEQEIFGNVISLGMKEYDQIVELSDEALINIAERTEKFEIEKTALKDAEDHFNSMKDIVGDIEDDELKKQAEGLMTIMNDRYEHHDKLVAAYEKGLELDRTLYENLKKEDLTMEELEKQITDVNKSYEEIFKANEAFNQETEKFNDKKLSFYESANIEIVEE